MLEMVNVRVAGLGSTLPSASIARTAKVWVPAGSGAVVVNGDEQGVHGPRSIRHSNREPASSETNVNVGVGSSVGPDGPEVIVVSGGSASPARRWSMSTYEPVSANRAPTMTWWMPSASSGQSRSPSAKKSAVLQRAVPFGRRTSMTKVPVPAVRSRRRRMVSPAAPRKAWHSASGASAIVPGTGAPP